MDAKPKRRVGVLLWIGIILMPFLFVWLLLFRRYPWLSRAIAFSWFGTVVFLLSLIPPVSTSPTEYAGDDSLEDDAVAAQDEFELPSPWTVATETSRSTDRTNVYLQTQSEAYRVQGAPKRANLTLRCVDNVTSVVWNWGEFLGDDDFNTFDSEKRMKIRFDDGAVEERVLRTSSNDQAVGLWNGSDAIPFIRRMLDAELMTVAITPYGENPRETVFDLFQLSADLPQLQEACGWT